MKQFAELDEIIKARGNLTKLFSVLKPLAREPIGENRLRALEGYFRFKDKGLAGGQISLRHPDYFYKSSFSSYQDWFTRKLSAPVLLVIKRNASFAKVVIPVECFIESIGAVSDASSIIRLKKTKVFSLCRKNPTKMQRWKT